MEELASVVQTLDDANPIKKDQNMMRMRIKEADDIEGKGKIGFEDFVNIMARKMQVNKNKTGNAHVLLCLMRQTMN